MHLAVKARYGKEDPLMNRLLAPLLLFGTLAGCGPFGSGTRLYGGTRYHSGDSFPSEDGCNTCSCGAQGDVACTLRACALPDAGSGDSIQCTGAAPSFPSFDKRCAAVAD